VLVSMPCPRGDIYGIPSTPVNSFFLNFRKTFALKYKKYCFIGMPMAIGYLPWQQSTYCKADVFAWKIHEIHWMLPFFGKLMLYVCLLYVFMYKMCRLNVGRSRIGKVKIF